MSLHFRTSDAARGPAVTRAFRFEFGTVAIVAGLATAMLLSGCTWFAPDAGMGVVATIAQQELNKDAAAIRSPEEAELQPPQSAAFWDAHSRPTRRSRSRCSTTAVCRRNTTNSP